MVVGKIVQQIRVPTDGGDDVRTKVHGRDTIECDHIRLIRHLSLIDQVKVDVNKAGEGK